MFGFFGLRFSSLRFGFGGFGSRSGVWDVWLRAEGLGFRV